VNQQTIEKLTVTPKAEAEDTRAAVVRRENFMIDIEIMMIGMVMSTCGVYGIWYPVFTQRDGWVLSFCWGDDNYKTRTSCEGHVVRNLTQSFTPLYAGGKQKSIIIHSTKQYRSHHSCTSNKQQKLSYDTNL